jgi:hypothetical protein
MKPESFICPIMSDANPEHNLIKCKKDCIAYAEKFDGTKMGRYWQCTVTNSIWRELKENVNDE